MKRDGRIQIEAADVGYVGAGGTLEVASAGRGPRRQTLFALTQNLDTDTADGGQAHMNNLLQGLHAFGIICQ